MIFDWENLDGKILRITIGKDIMDGVEVICVIGYDEEEDKYYVLHQEKTYVQ